MKVFIIVRVGAKHLLPYSGPNCMLVDIPKGKVYTSEDEALSDLSKLQKADPTAFRVEELTYEVLENLQAAA